MRIEELLDFLDIARTPLSERLFDLYREGSDGITFKTFTILTWNLCTRDAEGLVLFAFQLYDRTARGVLDLADVEMLVNEVFGEDWRTLAGARKIVKELCEVDLSGNPRAASVTVPIFMRVTRNAPVMLFPAFELQLAIQKRILGVGFWEKIAKRRRTLTERGIFDIRNVVTLLNEGKKREESVVALSDRHFVPYLAMHDAGTGSQLYAAPKSSAEIAAEAARKAAELEAALAAEEAALSHGPKAIAAVGFGHNPAHPTAGAPVRRASHIRASAGGGSGDYSLSGGAGTGLGAAAAAAAAAMGETVGPAGSGGSSSPGSGLPPSGAGARVAPMALPLVGGPAARPGGAAGSRRASTDADAARLGEEVSVIATPAMGSTGGNGQQPPNGFKYQESAYGRRGSTSSTGGLNPNKMMDSDTARLAAAPGRPPVGGGQHFGTLAPITIPYSHGIGGSGASGAGTGSKPASASGARDASKGGWGGGVGIATPVAAGAGSAGAHSRSASPGHALALQRPRPGSATSPLAAGASTEDRAAGAGSGLGSRPPSLPGSRSVSPAPSRPVSGNLRTLAPGSGSGTANGTQSASGSPTRMGAGGGPAGFGSGSGSGVIGLGHEPGSGSGSGYSGLGIRKPAAGWTVPGAGGDDTPESSPLVATPGSTTMRSPTAGAGGGKGGIAMVDLTAANDPGALMRMGRNFARGR